MGSWNMKGLRGSVLEELVNYTNEKYRRQNPGSGTEDSDVDQAGTV